MTKQLKCYYLLLNIRQWKFRQVACISSASASASTRDSASARHRALPYHCINQSFNLPPATTTVSHLTCPLPPHHQSQLELALEIELVLALDIEHYHITTSVSPFDLSTATTSSVTARASTRDRASASSRHRALPYHHISQSFDLPPATTSVSHLTCPLQPHHYVPTTPSSSSSSSSSASTSSSTSARELEIIEKFLCPHHL